MISSGAKSYSLTNEKCGKSEVAEVRGGAVKAWRGGMRQQDQEGTAN